MDLSELWPLALKAMRALEEKYTQAMQEKAAQVRLETLGYFWMLAAESFEPEPVTPALLRVRNPYMAPQAYVERMANAAARGYLRPVGRDGYLLTLKGHTTVHAVVQAAYDCMSGLVPLSPEKLERLADRLSRLVAACSAAADPPGTWCIAHSRKNDPGVNAPVVERIDQYLSDLAAFRDDAHLASWRDLGVDGPAWEALSLLWEQKAPLSLDALFDRLKRHGWEKEDYRLRLEALSGRGWVERQGEEYAITLAGDGVRSNAEAQTDRFFYGPWSCLEDSELAELRSLLDSLL